MKTSHSNYDLMYRRPTLCGYCHGLAAPYYTIYQGKRYGGCSLEHLEKIKRGEKMQDIKNFANINDEGIEYALKQAKAVYLDNKKETGTFELHKWTKEQRKFFVNTLVRSYLNHAHHQANTGESVNG